MDYEVLERHGAHGGELLVCRHRSEAVGGEMTFSLFVPPGAEAGPRPLLTFLSGLTCTHANATEKGEYRRVAAELGLLVVCPDTSPRGDRAPDADAYDLGQGAGFYLDAERAPWKARFRMESYVLELEALLEARFPVDPRRKGVFGHSMGGHGALTLALRHPGRWRSVSAFAPICAPGEAPWGRKAFSAYLGADETLWRRHDACALLEDGARAPEILIDVGLDDPFLDRELGIDRFERVCAATGQKLVLRRRPGYDHSYYFISTFMETHLAWHAERLEASAA